MEQKKQILCFGEILWDKLPTGRKAGGAPMNVALHLNRFGIPSVVASSVGNDADGNDLMDFLVKTGLSTRLVQRHPDLPTGEARIKLDAENNATFELVEPVAWDHIEPTAELAAEAAGSRAIVFGSLVSRNEYTRNTLLSLLNNDLLKIMDVNLRPPFDREAVVKMLLEHADIVKLNDDEMMRISDWYGMEGSLRERMEAFRTFYGLATLIVTRGKNGACLIHHGIYHEHSGYRVQTVDTVGSGDAFLAGFLAALFDGKDMTVALTEACAVGAFVATRAGATPEYNRADLMGMIAP